VFIGPGTSSAFQGKQEEIMVRRMMVVMFCFAAATVLCVGPQQAAADEKQAKEKAADQKKNEKATEENKDESFRDGINRAFDELKGETAKGKKNLNDLYEREKAKSGDEKAK
jgi:hypothetical protein